MATEAQHAGRRYRAFITYSHQDRRWAAWLHRRLEFYRVPRRLVGRVTGAGAVPRRLTPIFRDREELASAGDLSERIADALARSDALIVVCSPAAARSRWVNEEILRFKRSGRSNRVFCLITSGEPFASDNPDGTTVECFPPALRYRLDAAGELTSERAEPLAADARRGGDRRALALLKLVAGLLDLDLDLLRRRELQRRNRRWAAVTVVALLAMAGTSLLALEATLQRHAAERRQKQAEALVSFMLGNFTDKLRNLGRLDILASLDNQAMRYFESLPPGDVNEDTLIQRAKALQEIGSTRYYQGDYAKARDAFHAELTITSALARKHPQEPKQQVALSENLQWIGQAYYYQNKLAAAEKTFGQAAASLERAAALEPKKTDVQYDLVLLYGNLGHIALARGERDKAQADYTRSLQVSLHLVSQNTANVGWKDALGNVYDNLGQLAGLKGDFVGAVRNYQEEQLLIAQLARNNPSDQNLREHLVRSDGILGRTLFLCGQWDSGVRYLRNAVELADQLVRYDPTQTGWRYDRAIYADVLARMLLERGDADAAAALVKTTLGDLKLLTAKDPTRADWRGRLAAAQVTAALIAHARHDDVTARALATMATKSLEQTPTTGRGIPADPRSAASGFLLLADLRQAGGEQSSARVLRDKALAVIVPAAQASGTPRELAAAVTAQLAGGNVDAAKDGIARLQRMGFRTPAFVALLKAHRIRYPANTTVSKKIARIVASSVTANASAKTNAASPLSSTSPFPKGAMQ